MTAPNRPTLLLVDDEEEILVALEDLLEDRYDILSSSSPAEALRLLERHPETAVIVSDQRMPEMTGSQLLSRARGFSDAEAILLTGYADLSAVVAAVNEGAIGGYANKPWDPEALRAMIGAAADRFALRRALAFERAAFRGMAERSTDAIAVLDADGGVVRAHGDDQPASDEDVAVLRSGSYDEEDRTAVSADGAERTVRIRRIPFHDGERPYLLRITSDETERRVAARRLHQSEKLEALGTLAGGIAHDFNNLLAAILGNLELAGRRRDQPDRLARHLDAATAAAGRGSAITRRLLSFSRQRDLAAETFRPEDAIRSIEELIVRTAAGQVRLEYAFADDGWCVHTDPGQFELAIVNLCINARDAMPGGGTIRVATANVADAGEHAPGLSGPHVCVSVADEGTGMDAGVRDRVFEPFFTTKPQGIGTGLGLPMVRAMARSAGGEVSIDSAPDQGTTITLWLPRAEPIEVEPTPPVVHADRSLAVLVAEDDGEVRAILCEHLEHAGHRVTAVDSGAAALDVLAGGGGFDLLITDYAMPRLSGTELAKRARAQRPDLPVLLVTGFAEIEGRSVDLPVLRKPFGADRLRDAVAGAVGAPPEG